MLDVDPRGPGPAAWLRECREVVGSVPADKSLRDHGRADEDAHVPRQAKRTVDEVRRTVFPTHGLP